MGLQEAGRWRVDPDAQQGGLLSRTALRCTLLYQGVSEGYLKEQGPNLCCGSRDPKSCNRPDCRSWESEGSFCHELIDIDSHVYSPGMQHRLHTMQDLTQLRSALIE